MTNKEKDALHHSWRSHKNRLDSMLLSTNIRTADEVRSLCLEMDHMCTEDRVASIESNWGVQYLQKAMPILQQMAAVESTLGGKS